MSDVFTIAKPEKALPLVFDSPHSGREYPDGFKAACSLQDLARTEDTYIEELFESVPRHGGALLCALFPRWYIDVNRRADDIDPQLLSAPWPEPNTPSARSDAGIGLIRRLVAPGIALYDHPLSVEDIQSRLERYYYPYHKALQDLIDEAHYNFGQVYHINCHSMPDASAFPRKNKGILGHRPVASDFVLGDRDGTTCNADFIHALRDYLKKQGFRVTINDPFKGVEIVRRYSAPTRGRHSVQLEINKSLYMNEETFEKSGDFENFKVVLDGLSAFCAAYASSRLRALAAD